MRAMWGTMRAELVGAGGVVERNAYLTKRYIWWDVAWFVWTVANTLTIVFIAKGIEASGVEFDVERVHDVPAHRRRRLGVPRHPLRVPHGDRRLGALGGDDRVHVHGAALACHAPGGPGRLRDPLRARPRGLPVRRLRALLQPLDARRELRRGARHPRHLVDLVHRHRDDDVGPAAHLAGEGDAARLHRPGDAARRLGRLLPGRACCPSGCSALAKFSPATYALEGIREAILDGDGPRRRCGDEIWPLLLIGVVSIPLGLWVFRRGELYAKKHGKLKRSG